MEIWKDVPWYDGKYQVSNMWRIISNYHRNKIRVKFLSLYYDKDWYTRVHLYHNKIHRYYRLHRLVMLSFFWESNLTVNHKNWIKKDNRLENLEYCTHKENILHRYKVLWHKWRPKKVLQYNLKWDIVKEYSSITVAMNETNIDKSSIIKCCKLKAKTAGWYVWRYL